MIEKKTKRSFPEDFKREAVDRVCTSGLAVKQVSLESGVHATQLRRWMKQFGEQATHALQRSITQAARPSPADLAAENVRLKRELARAQVERDILLRVAVFRPHIASEAPYSTKGFLNHIERNTLYSGPSFIGFMKQHKSAILLTFCVSGYTGAALKKAALIFAGTLDEIRVHG